jgi:hypothetical protein
MSLLHPANCSPTWNRKAIHSKAGLDIADHRADCAFGANKCRQLKALRRHPQWPVWSEENKRAEEARILRELEVKRDTRKRNAEITFIVKGELKGEQAESDEVPADATGTERMSDGSDEDGGEEDGPGEGIEWSVIDSALLSVQEPDDELNEGRRKRRKMTLRPRGTVSNDDNDGGWVTDDDSLTLNSKKCLDHP